MLLRDGTRDRLTSMHVLFVTLDLGVRALRMLRKVFHGWMSTPGMWFPCSASALLITEGSDLCYDPQARKLHGNICFILHDNVHRDTLTPSSLVPSVYYHPDYH